MLPRHDLVATLPDTSEELVAAIEDPQSDADIEGWATALDAISECAICRVGVIQPLEFVEGALDHYELPEDERNEARDRLQSALSHSGAETGGWGSGFYCAYHNNQANKD